MVHQGGSFGKRKEPPAGDRAKVMDPSELRRSVRRPTFQNGKIFLETGIELTCAICNIGDGGCEISMRGVKTLPDEILISVGMAQEPRKAQVRWRDQNMAGLQFLSDEDAENGSNNSVS